MRKIIITALFFGVIVAFQFCSKNDAAIIAEPTLPVATLLPTLPASAFSYNVVYPAHVQIALAANDNTPANNAITNDGATLGRVLFYDKQLSKNNTIACASCHKQAISFDDDALSSPTIFVSKESASWWAMWRAS